MTEEEVFVKKPDAPQSGPADHSRLPSAIRPIVERAYRVRKVISQILDGGNGDEKRFARAKKHIKASFLIKGVSILISFILVPLTIGFVDNVLYGVWMTIFSVVSWFRFFDMGLDNGLRNKFAEALAKEKVQLARTYLSTTYVIMFFIGFIFSGLFLLLAPYLDFNSLLNVPMTYYFDLRASIKITVLLFAANFSIKLINTVLTADQRPSVVGFLNLISSVFILLTIWLMTIYTEGSLVKLAVALSGIPLIVQLSATVWYFATRYNRYRPTLKLVKLKYARQLVGLGSQFLIIQVIGIVIFSTDNVILSHLFSPLAVTPYTITHKYFGLVTRVFGIIALPFWSAYTDAYTQQDWDWIIRTNEKLKWAWKRIAVGSIVLLLISDLVYSLWVPEVDVYWLLSVLMWAYVLILSYGSIFVMFVNGIGKVRLQMVSSLIGGIANIPLSIFFARTLGLGPAGVILATIVCMLYGAILGPIQFNRLVNKRATGIWNK